MRYLATHLIYLAVLARAIGWSQDGPPIPAPVWALLVVFGLILATEPLLTRRLAWYPQVYALVQSGMVIAMLYMAPTVDILSLLFLPLSFQVVQYFNNRVGFAWIGVFSLAMAGMFFFGMEWTPGTIMILLCTAANLLMGSYAHLIRRTDQSRQENQRMFIELQGAYRQLKDYAAQQEQLAAAEERHRLVRELHDSLTQTLFSMNLAAQAALLSTDKGIGQIAGHLERLQTLSRSAAAEVQMLIGQAPARTLTTGELVLTLRQLVEERRARDGLSISLEVTGDENLPEPVSANLFRIAQEALNNISRHAGTCRVVVRLNLGDHPFYLEVQDTGRGFDWNGHAKLQGFGLTGMRERAREMGWNLEIDSRPGQGTRIRAQERVK